MSKVPLNNNNSKGEKSGGSIMSRRTFLGLSATTAAALTAAYVIDWPAINFGNDSLSGEGVIEEIIPWPVTSCLNCPTRCAIKVRVVNGKAVRILGNNKSRYSNGKTCPRSHIGLQVLYNPERFATKPLKRTNSKNEDPQWEEIEWEEALQDIEGKLNNLSSAEKLLIIQGLNTTSDSDLIDRFARSFGTTNLLREDTLETEANRKGKELANVSANSGYDMENANYILSFGANILESETPLSRHLNLWGYIRRERPNKARVVVIDSRYSVTASKADEWIPINPGTEGLMAMAIAYVIIKEHGDLYDKGFVEGSHASGFNDYRTLFDNDDFNPDVKDITDKIGVSAEVIRRIARDFISYKPAIAWSGTGPTSWPHGSYASYAILCLNALAGSIDAKGGVIYQQMPQYKDMPPAGTSAPVKSLKEVKEDLSNIRAIIGFNNNLIMSVPNTGDWSEALKSVPYYVHIGSAMNEMAQYADIILPACTYLEEWAYETAPPGSGFAEVKIKQPVISPLYNSRPVAQIIFDLAGRLSDDVKDAFQGIGYNPEGFIKYRTSTLDSFSWNNFKADGVWEDPNEYKYGSYDEIFLSGTKKFVFDKEFLDAEKFTNINYQGINSDKALILTKYHPVLDIRNGNQNYPWAQEIFLVMRGYGWNNFIEINKGDADERGIKDGDTVKVSGFGEIKIKARVIEGIKPGTAAIASGQGHYSCGEWADGIGKNPNEIIGTAYDDKSGQACFSNTKVEID